MHRFHLQGTVYWLQVPRLQTQPAWKMTFLICCIAKIYVTVWAEIWPLYCEDRPHLEKWNISAHITMPLDINQTNNLEGEIKIYEMGGSHLCLIPLYLMNTHAQFTADYQMCVQAESWLQRLTVVSHPQRRPFKKKKNWEFSLQCFLLGGESSNLFWPFSKAKSWRKYNV